MREASPRTLFLFVGLLTRATKLFGRQKKKKICVTAKYKQTGLISTKITHAQRTSFMFSKNRYLSMDPPRFQKDVAFQTVLDKSKASSLRFSTYRTQHVCFHKTKYVSRASQMFKKWIPFYVNVRNNKSNLRSSSRCASLKLSPTDPPSDVPSDPPSVLTACQWGSVRLRSYLPVIPLVIPPAMPLVIPPVMFGVDASIIPI